MNPTTVMVKHSSNVKQDYYGTIFMLNDDCLMEIFSYMDLRSLQTLASVCWRFKSICEYMYTRYRSLDVELCTPLRILHLMLHNVGSSLQSLKMEFCRESELVLVSKYCKSLRLFSIKGYSFPFNVKQLSGIFTNLQRLDLIDCKLSDKCLSSLLEASRKSSEASVLEELNISRNDELIGSALVDIVGLKVIDLSFCYRLKPEYFIEFVAKNKNLRKLNIIECDSLEKDCIKAISIHSTELEELHTTHPYDNCLDALQKLKNLRFQSVRDYILHGQNSWPKVIPLKYLEKLEIVQSIIFPDEIIDFITQCIDLKDLNDSRAKKITNDLISDIIAGAEELAIGDQFFCSYFSIQQNNINFENQLKFKICYASVEKEYVY